MTTPVDIVREKAAEGPPTMNITERELLVLAGKLTEPQRAYLDAVAGAEGRPYEPRHHRTANWALRHGYVCTMVRRLDGSLIDWDELPPGEWPEIEICGQVLTDAGKSLRTLSTPES